MNFSWYATVGPAYSLTPIQQAALDEINANLTAAANMDEVTLLPNVSLIDIPIQFNLTVENFLGLSDSDVKSVTRINKNIPTIVAIELRRTHPLDQMLELAGTLLVSLCNIIYFSFSKFLFYSTAASSPYNVRHSLLFCYVLPFNLIIFLEDHKAFSHVFVSSW